MGSNRTHLIRLLERLNKILRVKHLVYKEGEKNI